MTTTTINYLNVPEDTQRNTIDDIRKTTRTSNPLTRAWHAVCRFFTNPEQDSEAANPRWARDTKNGFHHGERFLL
jgi:hypothetical protein